jgi:GNAT superfamily N-acetyltransferase
VDQGNTIPSEIGLGDLIEARAWSDCFAAAPPALGCTVSQIPGTEGTLLRTSAVPAPFLNRVIGLSSATALTENTLAWIKQEYQNGMINDFWISVWDGLDDNVLQSDLELFGWTADTQTVFAKFLFDLQRPLPVVTQAPVTLRIRLAQAAERTTAGEIICRSFGLPPMMVPWMAAMVERSGWQMYFACDQQGLPIATGALFIHGTQAWLGMGATLPEARAQGAQQLLLATRLAAAKAAGCVVAAIDTEASINGEIKHSLNNIRKAGFRQIGQRLNYASPGA